MKRVNDMNPLLVQHVGLNVKNEGKQRLLLSCPVGSLKARVCSCTAVVELIRHVNCIIRKCRLCNVTPPVTSPLVPPRSRLRVPWRTGMVIVLSGNAGMLARVSKVGWWRRRDARQRRRGDGFGARISAVARDRQMAGTPAHGHAVTHTWTPDHCR
ncbi:hypothetical protein PUN28_003299 [Cardiocondyla obscurior]|uniref:Ribosomal protein L14 n=1 Tax=Cardiocondyla obscurior TaxID=286306 RepID=A0AAW2GI94_9HYME